MEKYCTCIFQLNKKYPELFIRWEYERENRSTHTIRAYDKNWKLIVEAKEQNPLIGEKGQSKIIDKFLIQWTKK